MFRRVLHILGNVLTVLLLAFLVAVAALAISERRSHDRLPHVAGRIVLNVLSGSMTPVFDTGSVVVDKPVTVTQAESLHIGQIVTYKAQAMYHGQPMLITHRIVGIVTVSGSAGTQHLYVTKGDANNAPDQTPVAPSQIIGVYQWHVPDFGYISAFIHKPLGFALFVGLPGLYLIGGEFLALWRALDESERQDESRVENPRVHLE